MKKKRLAIVSESLSDVSDILSEIADVIFFDINSFEKCRIDDFDALALLGGSNEEPQLLPINSRIKLENFIVTGRPVFIEWFKSFGSVYTHDAVKTSTDRMVYVGKECDLHPGDLLDDHCGSLSTPYSVPKSSYAILYNGGHILKHRRVEEFDKSPDIDKWALWYYSDTVLIASFRFSDFLKARFAPMHLWKGIMLIVAEHLLGKCSLPDIKPVSSLLGNINRELDTDDFKVAFDRGMRWLENADIYINEGIDGVSEGFCHEILPNGMQIRQSGGVRADCSGEVAGACFFDFILNKNQLSQKRFDNLLSFCFDKMIVKKGPCRGMMRWTTYAWITCYGDDVARAVLGALLYMNFTHDTSRLPDVMDCLDFLVKTTGPDGLRVPRTDIREADSQEFESLSTISTGCASSHFNAYYHAVLLLAYKLCGKTEYFDIALKGLSAIMEVFPNTVREHSETQELCRLILPLACLYEATDSEEHLKWLYNVVDKLEAFRHQSGAYMEFDTGYKAKRSRTAGTESSLLAENGDEIADLLYSLNWLPLAFSYAYYVTGNQMFYDRWYSICSFMVKAQSISKIPYLDGAWHRGVDLSLFEVYGMPHDVGWGVCCIESGWTVGEILMGLGFGLALKNGILPYN